MNRYEIEEEESSDIGLLWKQALDKYYADTKDALKDFYGKNGKALPEMDWNTDRLFKLQEEEADKFSKFRHKGDSLDKIRSTISKNSDIIQAVAQNVVDAASVSFPPASAIMTAFTYVMKASKKVSEAYDLIATFFDLLRSFLERLSLLEERLPTAQAYKTILMRVFSAIMVLCGLATKDMARGRFRQWGKALLTGSDDELRNSYDNLEKNIQRLESATMYATLKNTMEIKSDVKESALISKQTLKLATENLNINTENSISIREIKIVQNKVLRLVEEGQKAGEIPNGLKDSGAKKGVALNLIKSFFAGPVDPMTRFLDIQDSFVKNTFTWLDTEEGYQSLVDGTAPLVWVHGERGLGKTYLAYSIIDKLEKAIHDEPRTSIAYFLYNGMHEDFHEPKLMFGCIITMIAEFDVKYREEVATEIVRNRDELSKVEADASLIWRRFFVEKYPAGSDARLILVLAGLDKVKQDHRATLLGYFEEIRQARLNIQVVFTGRADLEPSVNSLSPVKIQVTKHKVSQKSGDLWLFAMARLNTMPKLRRLPLMLRKKIAGTLRREADSFLYVEHMLRRLHGLGREGIILKELKALPPDLETLYGMIVSECEESHNDEELTIIKKLLVWLTYSGCVLPLGSAKQLISVMAPNTTFSLEEELSGRCASILRLATAVEDGVDLASDNGGSDFDEREEDEESVSSLDDSSRAPIRFQELSLRQYFHETKVETGLRCLPSSAHLTLFEMTIQVLAIPAYKSLDDNEEHITIFDRSLQEYAADTWLRHFMNIEPNTASDHDTKVVIETLKTALDPTGEVLVNISLSGDGNGLFGDADETPEKFMAFLKQWSQRVNSLPPGFLSTEDINWIKESSLSLPHLMMALARGFIIKWFEKSHVSKAHFSFTFARDALLLADKPPNESLPEVDSNTGVVGHMEDTPKKKIESPEGDDKPLKAEDVLAVTNRFEDIAKSPDACMMISVLLSKFDFYDAAMVQIKDGLQKCTSDVGRYDMLCTAASIELQFAKSGDKKHTENAYRFTKEALTYRQVMMEEKKDSKDESLRYRIQQALVFQAECEIKLEKLDEALDSLKEARSTYKQPFGGKILGIVFAALEKQEKFELIMSTAEQSHRQDLLSLLYNGNREDHFTFQRAAKICGKEAFLIRLYERIIADLDYDDEGAFMRLCLARFYRFVLNKNDDAKHFLKQLVDGRKDSNQYMDAEGVILLARCDLADLLMEKFRDTLDPKEKTEIYDEMTKLVLHDRIALGADFSPFESQTAIPLALMAQKLGPTHDFQAIIDRAFRDNINALCDTVAWNDGPAFRMLAKVLACIPGLERDAQISLSLEFSDVDKTLSKSRDQPAEDAVLPDKASIESPINAPEEKAGALPDMVQPLASPNGNVIMVDAMHQGTVPGTATTEVDTKVPETDEDFIEYSIICSGCSKTWLKWADGPGYLCVICTDVDLCEECYQKITARNCGEEWKEWKTFCGPHHRYIRGPSEGWRGVKDGVIMVGGETIPFKEWLSRLETSWSKAWEDFWKRDVLVGDIL